MCIMTVLREGEWCHDNLLLIINYYLIIKCSFIYDIKETRICKRKILATVKISDEIFHFVSERYINSEPFGLKNQFCLKIIYQ